MDVDQLILEVVNGSSPADVLDGVAESVPNPIKIRKRIRSSAPELHKWLSDAGYLHDFASEISVGAGSTPKYYMDKYNIPKSLLSNVMSLM